MKKLITLASALSVIILLGFKTSNSHVDTYVVDTKQSNLEWYAEKVTGKHNGTILLSAGELKNNHGSLTGSFDIDMKSIENKDIKDASMKAKLEGHLKSADFFDVEKHPKATFVITSITAIPNAKAGSDNHTIKGNLTIKGKTNPISFPAILTIMSNKVTCVGSAIVDRSKYDVRYGSKTFFADIGDKMINDEFTLKFNIVAAQ